MMPYEAWYGEKPKVEHLRVYGCDAYSHIPKDERSKFDSKAKKCNLLGYGSLTKGYRLFDQSKRNVFHSRDITFNENKKESEVVSNNEPEIITWWLIFLAIWIPNFQPKVIPQSKVYHNKF